ncbi:hypothetical protein HY993_03345 [Candidatus Micrarchaeota archaeon]|nr:hypothetical protein [Candidatus Micrarchaeota archaeon]
MKLFNYAIILVVFLGLAAVLYYSFSIPSQGVSQFNSSKPGVISASSREVVVNSRQYVASLFGKEDILVKEQVRINYDGAAHSFKAENEGGEPAAFFVYGFVPKEYSFDSNDLSFSKEVIVVDKDPLFYFSARIAAGESASLDVSTRSSLDSAIVYVNVPKRFTNAQLVLLKQAIDSKILTSRGALSLGESLSSSYVFLARPSELGSEEFVSQEVFQEYFDETVAPALEAASASPSPLAAALEDAPAKSIETPVEGQLDLGGPAYDAQIDFSGGQKEFVLEKTVSELVPAAVFKIRVFDSSNPRLKTSLLSTTPASSEESEASVEKKETETGVDLTVFSRFKEEHFNGGLAPDSASSSFSISPPDNPSNKVAVNVVLKTDHVFAKEYAWVSPSTLYFNVEKKSSSIKSVSKPFFVVNNLTIAFKGVRGINAKR